MYGKAGLLSMEPLKFLDQYGEVAFIVEWDGPRQGKLIPYLPGFCPAYIDDPRELAIIIPTGTPQYTDAYERQRELMQDTWLSSWSQVVIITIPKKSGTPQEEHDRKIIYDRCMDNTAVMYSDEIVDVFVFHLMHDLFKAVHQILYKLQQS